MSFHWRLSDSKSPQVSRTLLSILAVFNNAVVWMVSTQPPTSKSSRPFNNPLVTVPKAPITIGIIVTFMFHSFFNSLARSRYLSLFSHSFSSHSFFAIIIIISKEPVKKWYYLHVDHALYEDVVFLYFSKDQSVVSVCSVKKQCYFLAFLPRISVL